MACSYTLTMAGCHLRERARSETLCAALEGALRCYPQQHKGMVALSLRWAANGGAERRSCGTSGFIDVQGAAAAKDLRRKGLVALTKRTC